MCLICDAFAFDQGQNGCGYVGLTNLTTAGDGAPVLPVSLGETITESGDVAGDLSTTAVMQVGDFFHGSIGTAGDSDWIAVDLVAGQTYTFAMAGIGALGNNVRDSVLDIRDSAGSSVASNDDIASSDGYYYSTVTYTVAVTGTYYIDAQAFSNFTGGYGVSVVEGDTASYDAYMGAGMLLSPNASWSLTPGTGATVSWGIRDSGTDPANGSPLITASAAQIAAISDILGYVDDVSGINYTQVNPGGTTNSATMLFGGYSASDGRGAYAYYPDSWGGGTPDTSFGANAGDVWMNNTSISTTSLPFGSYSHFAVMHEIGHTLGLAHPGPYNAGSGGTITYANNAEFIQDSHQYTIMSYFDETNTGASSGLGYPDTFMLFDYLALHQLYGADTTYNSGDTIYGFNSTEAGTAYDFTVNTNPLLCVYDGNGTDTIDLSGYSAAQTLSLVEGVMSNIGGYVGNFSIAYGAVIENAIGGSGNDAITGNSVANDINGGDGSDTLDGGAGADTLDGGAGADTLNGGAGADTIIGGDGDDVIDATDGADVVNIHASAGASITATGNAAATLNIHDPSAIIVDPSTIQTTNGATISHSGFGSVQLLCFCAGSLIATPRGEVAVEALEIGDMVSLEGGGAAAVRWIGRQTIVKAFAGPRACPVRIRAGALGGGLPHADLLVTGDHGMILDGLVINASALVNGTSIIWERLKDLPERFTVYHVETDAHQGILANGAESETYLDMPGRQLFDNFNEYLELYGEEREVTEMPRPRVASQRMLPQALWQRLGIVEAPVRASGQR